MTTPTRSLNDWRSLPRKPAHLKRVRTLTIRLTEDEADAIRSLSRDADTSIPDILRTWLIDAGYLPAPVSTPTDP